MPPISLMLLTAVPAFAALVLALCGRRMNRSLIGVIACVGVALSFLVGLGFAPTAAAGNEVSLVLGPWLSTGILKANLGFRLDTVAFAMVMLVSGFGFLITLYSVGYMQDDSEPARFFASLNLFVASM